MSDIENTDIIMYSLIIILFLLLYLIYFGAILYYFKYIHNRNLSILWIVFFITVSIGILFTIIYFITLLKNQANRKKYLIEHNSIASRFCSQTHFYEECYASKNYENNY